LSYGRCSAASLHFRRRGVIYRGLASRLFILRWAFGVLSLLSPAPTLSHDPSQDHHHHRRIVGHRRATARALAREGANLVLGARRLDRLEQVAAQCRGLGGTALAMACDVSSGPTWTGWWPRAWRNSAGWT